LRLRLELLVDMAELLRVASTLTHTTSSTETGLFIILGGDKLRECAAARSVAALPQVRVVLLSSGAAAESDLVSELAAVKRHDVSVCVDRRAVDTVSNCTSLAPDVASAGIKQCTLCTARAHSRRAGAVGTLIFAALGVRVRVRTVETGEPQEGILRCLRDVIRAILWVTIGLDLSSFAAILHSRRAADSNEWCAREGDASVRRLRDALKKVAAHDAACENVLR
jgi:hypothetical protein